MRGVSGSATITGPVGVQAESDTFTCFHCNRPEHVHWTKRDYTRCGVCDHLICHRCIGKGCKPFEKKLEAQLRAMEFYLSVRGNR